MSAAVVLLVTPEETMGIMVPSLISVGNGRSLIFTVNSFVMVMP